MSTKYKAITTEEAHFVTITTVGWVDPTNEKQDELLSDNDIDEIENPKKTNYYFR
jgi:hypothetical protein